MTKKILLRGVPDQVYSEQVGAVFPVHLDRQDDGKIVVGGTATIPLSIYNPVDRTMAMQRACTQVIGSAAISGAGATALWTPASGKRIRLMGFSVIVNPATTTAAGSLVTLKRGSTTFDDVIYLGVAALAVPARWAGLLPPNGYLLDVDEVLNVDLSAACTAGGIYINVWGTEE